MAEIYTRDEVLGRYYEKISKKQSLLFCGVGTGLIARICDSSGVDLIGIYNSGRDVYKRQGSGSLCKRYGMPGVAGHWLQYIRTQHQADYKSG